MKKEVKGLRKQRGQKREDEAKKALAALPCKRTAQRKGKIQTKGMDKKPGNRDESCKIIPLNSTIPSAGVEQQP